MVVTAHKLVEFIRKDCMATLISAADITDSWSIPLSASTFSGCGSVVGFRDNASGALLRVPLGHVAVKNITHDLRL